MNCIIVDDEPLARQGMEMNVANVLSLNLLGSFSNALAAGDFLRKENVDLMFLDINMPELSGLDFLKSLRNAPLVIFTTAYDKYLAQAFEYCSIDYLLKPISQDKLKNAIRKYKNLQNHFTSNHNNINEYLNTHDKKRSRILVKKGMEFQTVRVEDTGYFFTEHKLVFLVDKEGRKYMAEKNNLSELEEELDRNIFYRANRKYIINANYVKRFKPLERSKISVELTLPVNEEIIISQENSASFKKWIGEI